MEEHVKRECGNAVSKIHNVGNSTENIEVFFQQKKM